MSKITEAARGRDCTIRIEGCCNFNPETTVAAHYRMCGNRTESFSGAGIKTTDIHVAFACSACHERVDTDKSPETQLDFAKGVLRTQAILIREGIIRCR